MGDPGCSDQQFPVLTICSKMSQPSHLASNPIALRIIIKQVAFWLQLADPVSRYGRGDGRFAIENIRLVALYEAMANKEAIVTNYLD